MILHKMEKAMSFLFLIDIMITLSKVQLDKLGHRTL